MKDSSKKCIELYENEEVNKIVTDNRRKIYPFSKEVHQIQNIIESEEDERPTHICDAIDANAQQENLDDEQECQPIDTTELPEELSDHPRPIDSCKFKPIIVDEEDEMSSQVRKMSLGQRIVFDKMITFCNDVVRAKKTTNFEPNPPRIIVNGKAFHFSTLEKY